MSSDQIVISIKVENSNAFDLEVSKNSTIEDLKTVLEPKVGVQAKKIKLIGKGRALKDDRTLDSYKIGAGETIYMSGKATVEVP
jgi:uncharacterized ubiquitin-like protein YukD